MPFDKTALLAPGRIALINCETQNAVIGESAPLQGLAQSARDIVPVIAGLVDAAHTAGVPVIHGQALRRPDGTGANTNAPLFRFMNKHNPDLTPGSEGAQFVAGIPVADSDYVVPRLHGLSPFHGTEVDYLLRNLGVATVVLVGVSVNVAITNTAFDAVNAGYQVVIPRDAVASDPPEYREQVFQYTLANIATLVDSDEVIAAWSRD